MTSNTRGVSVSDPGGINRSVAGSGPSGRTALRIAIVGAESTGKSRLTQELAARLRADRGLHVHAVDELLRAWCDARGRTPTAAEQEGIARDQQALIEAAAAVAEVVVCDTTPLMTAVYSRIVFDDGSLDEMARQAHASISLTLLTALDLPWVADGLQRDGPHVREPVDRLIRTHLSAWGGEWAVVSGTGAARTTHALDALRPLLESVRRDVDKPSAPGLFNAIIAGADTAERRIAPLACEHCDDPDAERRTRRRGP